jgi:signal transduction histidine kinase
MVSADVARALARRIVLVILLGAVLPLGLIGLWTTRSAARSGRALLQSQLEQQLATAVRAVSRQWGQLRGDLLMLGESEPSRTALRDSASAAPPVPVFVQRAFTQMTAFDRVRIRDRAGRARWTLTSGLPAEGRELQSARETHVIAVRAPLTDLVTGEPLGSIEASLHVAALLPPAALVASRDGPLTAVFTGNRGSVVPSGADERLFADPAFEWSGHQWLTVRRPVPDLDIELAMAGALDPYVRPFARSATRSASVWLIAASAIVLLMVVLTGRMGRQVQRELSHREALAAVGEFASELAHEVRNPLTAMRLDLQRVEEAATDPATVRGIVPRVLRQIDRLDRAVSGALRVTRTGSMVPQPVALRDVLEAACRSAAPEFARHDGTLAADLGPAGAVRLDGDAGALEQMFLNLLINAAQALPSAGEARVSALPRDGIVEVAIADSGVGMTSRQLAHAGEPYRSTRRDGTGLGLTIARRIATAHGGALELSSAPGQGTTVRVLLPLRPPAPGG